MVSQHRYTPRMKEIKKYCGPKAPLGRPLTFFVRIHLNRPESYYHDEARRTGHGVLTIQGAHAMDWIGWLFGEVDACAAAIGALRGWYALSNRCSISVYTAAFEEKIPATVIALPVKDLFHLPRERILCIDILKRLTGGAS